MPLDALVPTAAAEREDSTPSLEASRARRSGILEVPGRTELPPILWVTVGPAHSSAHPHAQASDHGERGRRTEHARTDVRPTIPASHIREGFKAA